MTSRVTADEVGELIDTDRTLDSFIITASLIVTEELASAGHSNARLTQIELYLAAHFVALAEERGGLQRWQVGDSAELIANVYDKGFQMTRYGQQAMALDTSGALSAMSSTSKHLSALLTVV